MSTKDRKPHGYWSRPIPELAVAHATSDANQDGYIVVSRDGKPARLHRLVWEYFHGAIPAGMEIDHINGVRTDNRPDNLRCVSRTTNTHNNARSKRNTSGFAGVSLSEGAFWCAQWREGGKTHLRKFSIARLGSLRAKSEAIAFRAAQLERLGGYTERHGK